MTITPADWERMPWHARQRAIRRATAQARATRADEPTPKSKPKPKREPKREPVPADSAGKLRVRRVDGWWQITDGVSTAYAGSWLAAMHLAGLLTGHRESE